MNTRIKEFTEQAKLDALVWLNKTGELHKYYEVHLEKFVELIVKECAALTEQYAIGNTGSSESYNYSHKIKDVIDQHFRVEKMHERIHDLTSRAEFSKKDLYVQGDTFEKFVGLLVTECATLTEQYAIGNTGSSDSHTYSHKLGDVIVQHFEIEK